MVVFASKTHFTNLSLVSGAVHVFDTAASSSDCLAATQGESCFSVIAVEE